MFDYSDYITGNRLMYVTENIPWVYAFKIDRVMDFLQHRAPKINNPFCIVTHWGDFGITQEMFNYANQFPMFTKWYGQNIDCEPNPKLHSLPIGLEDCPNNLLHGETGCKISKTELIHDLAKREITPSYLVYANFYVGNYPKERETAYRIIQNASWALSKIHPSSDRVVTRPETTVYINYLNDIKSSYYVMCPRGGGIDTHRLWETLYLNRIPIVKRCHNTHYYQDLPVLIVDEWEQVTETLLKSKLDYFNNKSNFNMDKLKMSWWSKLLAQNI